LRSDLSPTNSDENSSPNRKGNSKANWLEIAIPKSRFLKEIEEHLPGEEGSLQKSRPGVEKFAHIGDFFPLPA
jgi:hypothetical protein